MITSIYVKRYWLPKLRTLNRREGSRVRKLLQNRDDAIPDERVKTIYSSEIFGHLSLMLTAKFTSPRLQRALDRTASEIYGRLACKHIKPPIKLIHSRSGFSRQIIPHAHRIGAKVLLEQSAAHPEFASKILAEEYERWGVPPRHRTFIRPTGEMEFDIARADYVLTNSPFVADTVRPHVKNPNCIEMVYTGADLSRFRPAVERVDSTFRVLFVGSLSTFKGVMYLLRAFKNLRLPNAELIMVGNYHVDCPPEVRKSTTEFHHIPHVPYSEMPQYFSQASVFVCPYIAEGCARTVLEAMAAGLPCIVTHNSGSVLTHGVDGLLVPARDEESLAEQLLLLYRHPDLGVSLGRAARRKALASLSWEHYMRNLLSVYRKLLAANA
ncbi:MAG: glycosyltransferase family 4 protein [Acidobacteriota bacterium]